LEIKGEKLNMITETKISKKVKVTNRNNGFTGYHLQNGTDRIFSRGQSMMISLEELDLLQNTPGGDYIIKNLLIIEDKDVLDELNVVTEPEYFYTEAEINELLNNGSLDQLEDCLNFAPEGVIELIKTLAVKNQLPDTKKRDLITKKTGFNIDNAINVNKIMNVDSEKKEDAAAPTRKAEPIIKNSAPTRKAEPVKTLKLNDIK
jgi:hypothetical protein